MMLALAVIAAAAIVSLAAILVAHRLTAHRYAAVITRPEPARITFTGCVFGDDAAEVVLAAALDSYPVYVQAVPARAALTRGAAR